MRIIVGLSGGVDSAVTAALLVKEGHEVTGVSMSIWEGPEDAPVTGGNACYGPDEREDLEEAARIASILGIPYHIFPIPRLYQSSVLETFRSEYASGRTPNPCIICNAKMKFGALLAAVEASGISFDRMATGHYARIRRDDASGRYLLLEALDKKKDQTYFLHRLSQESLSKALFPLGGLVKEEVRSMAREWGLPVHDKSDSKGFYAGDYREILNFEDQEGPILDEEGNELGRHSGIWNFTIGQRRGINIPGSNNSFFVTRLDRERNAVIVGGKKSLYRLEFLVGDFNWIAPEPSHDVDVEIKISNTHPRARGKLSRENRDGIWRIAYESPQVAIAPGQAAVFYDGEVVLGGGYIISVL